MNISLLACSPLRSFLVLATGLHFSVLLLTPLATTPLEMSEDKIASIVRFIKGKMPFEPDVGIVCGSGLGGLAVSIFFLQSTHYSPLVHH